MSIARPETKEELLEHVKLKLGFPVVKINMDEMQFRLALEEALELWVEHAADAKEETKLVVSLSNDDILKSGITLPKGFIFVRNVLDPREGIGFMAMQPGAQFWLAASGVFGGIGLGSVYPSSHTQGGPIMHTGLSMTEYSIMRQWLETAKDMFDMTDVAFSYNTRTRRLYANRFGNSNVGDKFLVLGWMRVDVLYENQPNDFWNDPVLKRLVYAKCLYQWGQNLSKYTTIQLPSGAELNGEGMISRANEELEQALESLREEYANSGGDILIG